MQAYRKYSILFFLVGLFFVLDSHAQSGNLRLAFTGDIMLGTNYPDSVYDSFLPRHSGHRLLRNASELLSSADLAFGNLEGVFLNDGGVARKYEDAELCYRFRTPLKYASLLGDAGYDAISIANNHINDFGKYGMMSTYDVLDSLGMAVVGLDDICEYREMERDGIKVGFCAFACSEHTLLVTDTLQVRQLILSFSDKCDILVVSFHAGAEGPRFNRVPFAMENYEGQSVGDVHAFAHTCIDAGADVVFGHGPHVVRAMELYKGKLIAYSLGNFCTPFRYSLRETMASAPLLVADVDRNGDFRSGELYSFRQSYFQGPEMDENNRAYNQIKELTALDFPDTKLEFPGDNQILIKTFISNSKMNDIITFSKKYLGVRYRFGGNSPAGFDCSGFTSYIYGHFGYDIGRSSRDQLQMGKAVKIEDLRPGDIVVFGGTRSYKYPGHVGIVVEAFNDKKDFTFIHAARRGIVIDRFSEEEYYQPRYIGARRVVEK